MGSANSEASHLEKKMNAITKNAKISSAILANVAKGMGLPAAYDAVFGEGAYVKMAGQIYEALRAN